MPSKLRRKKTHNLKKVTQINAQYLKLSYLCAKI